MPSLGKSPVYGPKFTGSPTGKFRVRVRVRNLGPYTGLLSLYEYRRFFGFDDLGITP